jgi:beta-lactamase superfamily II metal-dependent hydrolase
MQVTIKSLNVKDGDAIIVNLTKPSSNLLFLIDGGHSSDSDAIIQNLNPFLEKTGKQAPDFILCTHYDDDHIGGLFSVVKYFGSKIKKVWMHKTSEKFDISKMTDFKTHSTTSTSIFPGEDNDYLVDNGITHNTSESFFEDTLKSLKQEIEFLELLKTLKIQVSEPIMDKFYVEDWPELLVIGPSLEYYKSLFPDHFNTIDYVKSEIDYLKSENISFGKGKTDYNLDTIPKSKVTPPNLNSAILLLSVNGNKFLFTGDAGIPSFKAIDKYEEVLSNLFWLKVPHHASKNNIDTELINIFKPKNALISGDRHISNLVSDYLKSIGTIVRSTKDENDILYSFTL